MSDAEHEPDAAAADDAVGGGTNDADDDNDMQVDEAVDDRRPAGTPQRSTTNRPSRESSGSGSSGMIPPTPAGAQRGDDSNSSCDDDDDNNQNQQSPVPPTPMQPASRSNDGAPLTPLSVLEIDDEEEGDAEAAAGDDDDDNNNADNNDEQQQPAPVLMGDNDQDGVAHIRGTDVHVPTAAEAFTDFLQNFKSLKISQRNERRRQRQQQRAERASADDDDASSSDDDDSLSSLDEDNDDEDETQPLYLARLQSLVEHGAIMINGVPQSTTSLDIDTMHLYYHSPACQRFYHQLVAYPMELVPIMDILVQRELERLADEMAQEGRNGFAGTEDGANIPRIQVRPFNLKDVANLRCLDPVSMDSLLSIKGMIVRSSSVIPDLKVAHFACTICGHSVQVTIDRGRIAEPRDRCPQCQTAAYQLVHNRSVFADKQLVRLQETPDEVPAGQTPASVVTFCFDDLVDSVQPGDKVEVTGVLRAQPVRVNPKISKVKSVYKTYVDVIHFRKVTGMESVGKNRKEDLADVNWTAERIKELTDLSKDPDIYEKLMNSLAPSIWELDNEKKGILCMLFGGNHVRVKKGSRNNNADDDDDASRSSSWLDEDDNEGGDANGGQGNGTAKLNKRGDINILLCGDPGTSKSQLLGYVNKLSSRGVYTSGKGSSAVGLTASVIRDSETKDLVLESGALVLSDQGICCIDEFDKMSDTTRSVLHEAMEQQTVSIAKAGIIATLHARTSILASANPSESRYNPSMSVVENIKLPPTLLSRFDLIYLILDSPNVDHDRRLAQHLVGLYYETPNIVKPPLDHALLKDYIEYARENIHPEISDEAADQLVASYLEMRNPAGGSSYATNGTRTISATPRQLESLVRLSEALARMRYSKVVRRSDACEAVRLMRVATQAAATDPRTGRIDYDMITTGRSTSDREMEAQLSLHLKELLAKRRGNRMAVRDVTRQLSEIVGNETTISHDDVMAALRLLEADGVVQLNERAQTIFVRGGIVR